MPQSFDILDLWYYSPLLTVVVTGLVVLAVESVRRAGAAELSFGLTLTGTVVALILSIATYGTSKSGFAGSMVQGAFGSYFTVLFLLAGMFSAIVSREYLRRLHVHRGEFHALLLFAVAGMMLMASGVDLIVIFLGVELMSLSFYVLVGYTRSKTASNESALKYFLLGAFATGFLLYGIALVYGTTGTTNLISLGRMGNSVVRDPVFLIGAGMIVIALAFKTAAAPFHMWAPDVYQGAPTSVTAFMATAGKAAAFASFAAVFMRSLEFSGTEITTVLAGLAALSMVIGNFGALAQTNVKRMLAYSSVAHAGYMLTGVAAGNEEGLSGIMYYAAAYLFMNIGAFTVVGIIEGEGDVRLAYADYAGLSGRHPGLAFMMSVFLFSLTGIPPTAGFFGKYSVFLAAVKADLTWLAILGVLTSLISAYYYLGLVIQMYFREGDQPLAASAPGGLVTAAVSAFVVLQLGVFPSLLLQLMSGAF